MDPFSLFATAELADLEGDVRPMMSKGERPRFLFRGLSSSPGDIAIWLRSINWRTYAL